MFTFIHAADVHLDSPLRGLSRYESAPADAVRGACRKAFENLVDLAIAEKVAFVLLAGDLYDGNWKDYSTGIYLSHQVGRLSRHNIMVYAVAGNHDAANTMTKSLETPDNMKIFSSRKTESVILPDAAVAIHGQSFDKQHVQKNLAAGYGTAIKGLFNIGILHTSLDGRQGHAVYAPCGLDDLLAKGYQYWALGHVHRQEIVAEDPWVVFPGCIQGRHIREAGPKGCMLVHVEDGFVREVETRDLDVLRWVDCRVDVSDASGLQGILARTRKAVEKAQLEADGRFVAIRIRLEGATEKPEAIAAYPERFEQQLRAIGAEIGGNDLWIERVENSVVGKLELSSVLAEDSGLAQLLEEIGAVPGNPDDIEKLAEVIETLRQKIPPDVFADDDILYLDDPRLLERLVDEAKQMLTGRLLTAGGRR